MLVSTHPSSARIELQKEEFYTYESEMNRLESLSSIHVPSLLGGVGQFLGSVNKWVSQGDDPSLDGTVVVFPDPTANLSLPYPADELVLAVAASGTAPVSNSDPESLAEKFNISSELLER